VPEAASLPRFLRAFRDLVGWLREAQVPGVVIGGIAASLLGRPRVTKDIDLLISADPDRWPALVDRGARFRLEPRISDAVEFARRSRMLLLRHQPSKLDVDVTVAGLPFEEEALRRPVMVEVGGLQLPVASPEDLIVMKSVAHRPQDVTDVEGLLDRYTDLDLDRVKDQLREFSAVLGPEILDDFLKLLRRRGG
jgi:Nucleotidyltransferase of unknown function (DUF6036)